MAIKNTELKTKWGKDLEELTEVFNFSPEVQ